MGEWALAVSVLAAMAALATLAQRVVSQLLGRVDTSVAGLSVSLEQRLNRLEDDFSKELDRNTDV